MVALNTGFNHRRTFSECLDSARRYFDDHQGHPPVVFGFKLNMPTVIAPVSMDNNATKDAASELMGNLASRGADAVVLVTEGWNIDVKSRDEVRQWAGRVSTHPNRREVLSVAYQGRRMSWHAWAVITRDADDNPTLGEWQYHGEDPTQSSEGRFCEAFKSECKGK